MKLHLNAQNFDLTSELEKYTDTKLAYALRPLPRELRRDGSCTVTFKQRRVKAEKFNTCTITCRARGIEVTATETTQHMYAALDIAAVHIRQQLNDLLKRHELNRRSRLKRRIDGEWVVPGSS